MVFFVKVLVSHCPLLQYMMLCLVQEQNIIIPIRAWVLTYIVENVIKRKNILISHVCKMFFLVHYFHCH